ncbi:MAG: tRNA glutamyl-Q(34) synthetase GluQRS [Bdellovibrio bacteriovorus]
MGPAPPPDAGRPPAYRGRFAPSPTGPLHFGSLIAAVASFADARAAGGTWLVRMEDLDRPREVPGAARQILKTLAAFGLEWDGPVLYQSTRCEAYAEALTRLAALALTYPCGCSRRQVASAGRQGPEGPIYPGTCRAGIPEGRQARALRLRTDGPEIRFPDRIQGPQRQVVAELIGDFVIRRADGIHAYHLAVVLDDAWQGVNQVVRGADLLVSTPRQILLQQALGLPTPHYAHVPRALGPDGRKLSKSLDSAPVDPADPLPALNRAWAFLGQMPLGAVGSPQHFWSQAISRWRIARVPRRLATALGPGAPTSPESTQVDAGPIGGPPSRHKPTVISA